MSRWRSQLMALQESCQDLQEGVDWTVVRYMLKQRKSKPDKLIGLRALWQGAVFRGKMSTSLTCPKCNQPATMRHIKYWQDKDADPQPLGEMAE